MKNLQFSLYQYGVGWGRLGLKSLNLSPPHYLCGTRKTWVGRSGKGRVKQSGARLPSLSESSRQNVKHITCLHTQNKQ